MAVADADSPVVRVYVSDGSSDAVGQFNGHSSPVLTLAYNEPAKTVVSADRCVQLLYVWSARCCHVIVSSCCYVIVSSCPYTSPGVIFFTTPTPGEAAWFCTATHNKYVLRPV